MSYVLLQALDGAAGDLFVAPTFTALRDAVAHSYTRAIAAWPGPWSAGNQGYLTKQKDALLAMLEAAAMLPPGRHVLPNRDPQWEEWTLLVPPANPHIAVAYVAGEPPWASGVTRLTLDEANGDL